MMKFTCKKMVISFSVFSSLTLYLQEAQKRKHQGLSATNFAECWKLQDAVFDKGLIPGEDTIVVQDLLEKNGQGQLRAAQGMWMTFDFLVGSQNLKIPQHLEIYSEKLLNEIDTKIHSACSTNET